MYLGADQLLWFTFALFLRIYVYSVFLFALKALREEVQAKGPSIDSFLNRYRDLTQHNPSLVDPVMRAVREDWEELLGQIENLLEEREQNLQASRELQEAQNTMDDDLENYVKELERIEKEDVAVQEKSLQLKVRAE